MKYRRKKTSKYTTSLRDAVIDYKNVNELKNFIAEGSAIVASRITGTCSKVQRKMAKAIKIARIIALLPFSDSHNS